mgnify:CR=1 FL=1
MKKKNKRKETEFKKPFIVLSRRKIAGWDVIILFLSGWMFILGILVGRGTAPVQFDITALEKKIEASKKGDGGDQRKSPAQKKPVIEKNKTKLEFNEAIKENNLYKEFNTQKKTQKVKGKIKKQADDTASRETKKKAIPQPASAKSASQKAGTKKPETAANSQIKKPAKKKEKAPDVARTNATGPVYTIQAASVKDPKDADRMVQKLKKSGYPAYRAIGKIPGKGIWFRVRIGQYKRKAEALSVMNKLKKDGVKPNLVMK